MAKHFGSIDRQQAHKAKFAATQRIAANDPPARQCLTAFFRKAHAIIALRHWKNGAGYRIRTRGPLITNQVLYQLS